LSSFLRQNDKSGCDLFEEDSFLLDASPEDVLFASEMAASLKCLNYQQKTAAKELSKRIKRILSKSVTSDDEWRTISMLTRSLAKLTDVEIAVDVFRDAKMDFNLLFNDVWMHISRIVDFDDNNEVVQSLNMSWLLVATLLDDLAVKLPLNLPAEDVHLKFFQFLRRTDTLHGDINDLMSNVGRLLITYASLRNSVIEATLDGENEFVAGGIARMTDFANIKELNSTAWNWTLLGLHAIESKSSVSFGLSSVNSSWENNQLKLNVTACNLVGLPLDRPLIEAVAFHLSTEEVMDVAMPLVPTSPTHFERVTELTTSSVSSHVGPPLLGVTFQLTTDDIKVVTRRTLTPIVAVSVDVLQSTFSVALASASAVTPEIKDVTSSHFSSKTNNSKSVLMPLNSFLPGQSDILDVSLLCVDEFSGMSVRSGVVLSLLVNLKNYNTDTIPIGMSPSRILTFPSPTIFGLYLLRLPLTEKRLPGLPGTYTLGIIAGGNVLNPPTTMRLAEVEMLFPSVPPLPSIPLSSDTSAKTRQVLHEEAIWYPRNVIVHTFEPPRTKPSILLSSIFFILSFVIPILGLCFVFRRFGVNCRGLTDQFSHPQQHPHNSKSSFGIQVLFQLLLLSFHILLAVYWWRLRLFTVLQLSIPLGIITLYVGNRALCDARARRIEGSVVTEAKKVD